MCVVVLRDTRYDVDFSHLMAHFVWTLPNKENNDTEYK